MGSFALGSTTYTNLGFAYGSVLSTGLRGGNGNNGHADVLHGGLLPCRLGITHLGSSLPRRPSFPSRRGPELRLTVVSFDVPVGAKSCRCCFQSATCGAHVFHLGQSPTRGKENGRPTRGKPRSLTVTAAAKAPIVKKNYTDGAIMLTGPNGIQIAYAAEQGAREEMEDEVAVVADVPNKLVYAAVFDGHVSPSSAHFLRDCLYEDCVKALQGGALLEEGREAEAETAIVGAFERFDQRLMAWLDDQPEPDRSSGSTGTVVFLRDNRVIVASIGDTKAVMGSANGEAVDLSEDHRPWGDGHMARVEIKRLKEAGAWVSHGRVCGSLAVSRAFGDIPFKAGRKDMLDQGLKKGKWTPRFVSKLRLDTEWITARPDVVQTVLADEDEFLIVGSDGLWDVVRSSEAVRAVQEGMKSHGDLRRACGELMHKAIVDRRSNDNTSIIIIELRGRQS